MLISFSTLPKKKISFPLGFFFPLLAFFNFFPIFHIIWLLKRAGFGKMFCTLQATQALLRLWRLVLRTGGCISSPYLPGDQTVPLSFLTNKHAQALRMTSRFLLFYALSVCHPISGWVPSHGSKSRTTGGSSTCSFLHTQPSRAGLSPNSGVVLQSTSQAQQTSYYSWIV